MTHIRCMCTECDGKVTYMSWRSFIANHKLLPGHELARLEAMSRASHPTAQDPA